MNYDLAKELKDAGFPRQIFWHCIMGRDGRDDIHDCRADKPDCMLEVLSAPNLEELIEACGEFGGFELRRTVGYGSHEGYAWKATLFSPRRSAIGDTHTEAVARLWLALKRKDRESR